MRSLAKKIWSCTWTFNLIMCIMCPNSLPSIMILTQAVLQIYCWQDCFTIQMTKSEKVDNSAKYLQNSAKTWSGHLHLWHKQGSKSHDPSTSGSPVILLTRFHMFIMQKSKKGTGARWLSGRVSDSGARGPGFETYLRRVCPWARHFTPRKYWLITQEAMAPSRHDWKIVDRDVKPQHNQPTNQKGYNKGHNSATRSPTEKKNKKKNKKTKKKNTGSFIFQAHSIY